MKILSRYFLSQFFAPFLLAILGFSVLILIIQVFDELHYVMLQKPGLWFTIEYYFLIDTLASAPNHADRRFIRSPFLLG